MEGESNQLSDFTKNHLELINSNMTTMKKMNWDEIRQSMKQEYVNRSPGEDVHKVRDITCFEDGMNIPLRIYEPSAYHCPVIVYFHGGGFVLGDLNSHDYFCRRITNYTNCVVISIDYSRAPEHKYPKAINEGLSVLKWIFNNSSSNNWDPSRVMVVGDSAGGTLATVVANRAIKEKLGVGLIHQFLIYPVTDLISFDTLSYKKFGEGYLLETWLMKRFVDAYMGENTSNRFEGSPYHMSSIKDSPPATIITAGYDPLRDEGRLYADRLRQCKIPVRYENFDNMIHGFANLADDDQAADLRVLEMLELMKNVFDGQ